MIKQSIKNMASSVSGGHAVMAEMLGLSKAALENRIYEVKGQRVSVDEALMMQRLTERTDFAEAVAAESGGVFVKLPEGDLCAALAEEEISNHFLNIMQKNGALVAKWRETTADGQVTARELRDLQVIFHQTVAEAAAVMVLTEKFFMRGR